MEKRHYPFKRFIVLYGEEFSTKYPVVYDIFCQELVFKLRSELDEPKGKELMAGLVAQSLVTPEAFTEGFLYDAYGEHITNFIDYGWDQAIQEGLKYKNEDVRKSCGK